MDIPEYNKTARKLKGDGDMILRCFFYNSLGEITYFL